MRYSGRCQDIEERKFLHELESELFEVGDNLELEVYLVEKLGRSSSFWFVWLFRVFGYDYEPEVNQELWWAEEELVIRRLPFVMIFYAWSNNVALGRVH